MLLKVLEVVPIITPHLIEIRLENLELLDGLLLHLIHVFTKINHLGLQIGILLY